MPLALLPLLVAFIVLNAPEPVPRSRPGYSPSHSRSASRHDRPLNLQDALTLNQRLRTAYESVWKARAQLNERNEQLAQDLEDEHERATHRSIDRHTQPRRHYCELDEILASGTPAARVLWVSRTLITSKTSTITLAMQLATSKSGVSPGRFRPRRIVGRMGGDEFLIILAATDEFSMRLYQREVRARLTAASGAMARYDLGVGVSMGFAVSPGEGSTLEDLLRLADARMYVEKVATRTAAA
jgi:hypothetical protein